MSIGALRRYGLLVGFLSVLLVFIVLCVCVLLPITLTLGVGYFLLSLYFPALQSMSKAEYAALVKMDGVGPISRFLTSNRSAFVIGVVLPMSLVFDMFFYLRAKYIFLLNSAPQDHDERVAKMRASILAWKASGSTKKLCTSRPGWVRISPKYSSYKKNCHMVETPLYDILGLDEDAGVVTVEPLVSMGQLTEYLVPRGYTVPVLPEMDDLTVGGLVCGCGIESSSHIYGLFQSTCEEFTLLTADGELIVCSRTQRSDIFYSIPWSYGSLGLLVSVKLKVIKAKPWVRLQYKPCHSQEELVREFAKESDAKDAKLFVEALVYSEHESVLMTGEFADAPEASRINCIGKFWKPWFFKHVQTFLGAGKGTNTDTYEYIPLRDYYHRHTKAIFWEMQDIIPVGNHPFIRYFFGWMMPPKVSFLKLTTTQPLQRMYEEQHVIQDMLVPLSTFGDSLKHFHSNFELYPLWVCPMRLFKEPGMLQIADEKTEMYVDIGAYGVPASARVGKFDCRSAMRKCEAFVRERRGFQMLYADSYLSREEFRSMFDHSLLDTLRKELHAEGAFPEPYDKLGSKYLQGEDGHELAEKPTKKNN